jgi:hypothetical protein
LYDYSKGIDYYEEVHPHLMQDNNVGKVYAMGMGLLLGHGLKFFLNKFRRKETISSGCDIPYLRPQPLADIEDSSQELIFLLAEMIRTAGNYHGAG